MDIEFEKVKETKNKIRLQECTPEGDTEKVGALYVDKSAYEEIGSPEKIKVTIEAA